MWWPHWKVVKEGGAKFMDAGPWGFILGVRFCAAPYCIPILYFLAITMGLLFLTWWARAVNRNKPSSPKHVLQVSCLWEENGNWARVAEICHQVTFGRWVGSGEMSGAQTTRIRRYHQMPPCQAAQSLPCSSRTFCIFLPTLPSLCVLLPHSFNMQCT